MSDTDSTISSDLSDFDVWPECEEGAEGTEENVEEGDWAIQPYMFEPEAEEEEEHSDAADEEMAGDDGAGAALVDHTVVENWCTCGSCQVLPTRGECVCCRQVAEFGEKMEGLECFTRHEDFANACLNRTVLEIAWLQYRQQYGKQAYDGPLFKKLRHVAYRQVVRWTYGYLGKDIRVVIPSCVVCNIRAVFPAPGLEENAYYQGFVDGQ
ncbi:uncharacterized protein LOC135501815 [Lineus longissimus]|uniref:uncharacterized protein LOC135495270 n=1 Tax=Lineus longissimus TaxID=88925 RepID=UPI002B4D344D